MCNNLTILFNYKIYLCDYFFNASYNFVNLKINLLKNKYYHINIIFIRFFYLIINLKKKYYKQCIILNFFIYQ